MKLFFDLYNPKFSESNCLLTSESQQAMQALKVIPLLRIFDRKKAEEFYIQWLGFSVDWEHRFEDDLPLYIQVSKAGITLHLTEHHGDCSPGQ